MVRAGFKLTVILLFQPLSAEITGVSHHIQFCFLFSSYFIDFFCVKQVVILILHATVLCEENFIQTLYLSCFQKEGLA